MDRKISVIIALMITGLFPAATIYAWQNRAISYTEEQAVDIALDFVVNSPTFLFDGIMYSVEMASVEPLRMLWTWEVKVRFQCSHAGYGDRTGMVLAQVITAHEIRVVVSEGVVIRATVDETWDELNQRELAQSELLPPEYAKDLAIQYIILSHPELDLELPEAWAFEVLTPEGLVGASTHQFTGGNWEVNVSYAVVMRPDYTVSIRYTGDVSFTWEGTVDQSSNVEETTSSLRPSILSQEYARDIAVSYLMDSVEQLQGLEAPSEWAVEDLTPEGLLGYSSVEFRADGWTVKVSNPVVWKPTYEVDVEYSGEFTLTWKGTVDQSGSVEETTG